MVSSSLTVLTLAVALISAVSPVLAGKGRPKTADPFADPKHDLNNPLRYIPSNALSAVGVAFYLIVSVTMVWLLNKSRWSARYMLCVIIGGFGACAAFRHATAKEFCFDMFDDLGCSDGLWSCDALRSCQAAGFKRDIHRRIPVRRLTPTYFSLYPTHPSLVRFVVLSPCAFIAGNYILLGRLSRHLNVGHYLLVNPAKITKIFVASDITTFLIQASGGGLSTADNVSTAIAGSHVRPPSPLHTP